MTIPSLTTRRGATMLLVLLAISMGALVAASVLTASVSAQREATRASSRLQSRLVAWSGIEAAMAEFASQREALLKGGTPTVTARYDLFTEGRRIAVARLVPWTSRDAERLTQPILAQAETAKLDLNHSDGPALEKLNLFDEQTITDILAGAAKRPWTSVEELATLPGVSLSALYGTGDANEIEPLTPAATKPAPVAPAASPGSPAKPATESSEPPVVTGPKPAIVEALTTLSFDPNVQVGLGGKSDSLGVVRANINVKWSDELGKAVAQRLGQGSADSLKRVMESGRTFKKDADIVGALREFGVPKDAWAPILDTLTTSDDMYLLGRVDINHAEEGTLAALPGFTAQSAKDLVSKRQQTPAEQRESVTWPVVLGVMTEDDFQAAVDFITSRSMQWRIRVEAGFVRSESTDSAELEERVEWEAVIDIASERPRVAYLREITHLPVALAMEKVVKARAEKEARDLPPQSPPASEPTPPPATMNEDAAPPSPPPATDKPTDPPPTPPADQDSGTMKDRRTGRWTAGGRPQ